MSVILQNRLRFAEESLREKPDNIKLTAWRMVRSQAIHEDNVDLWERSEVIIQKLEEAFWIRKRF